MKPENFFSCFVLFLASANHPEGMLLGFSSGSLASLICVGWTASFKCRAPGWGTRGLFPRAVWLRCHKCVGADVVGVAGGGGDSVKRTRPTTEHE